MPIRRNKLGTVSLSVDRVVDSRFFMPAIHAGALYVTFVPSTHETTDYSLLKNNSRETLCKCLCHKTFLYKGKKAAEQIMFYHSATQAEAGRPVSPIESRTISNVRKLFD